MNNIFVLIGRLTREVELKKTSNGKNVCEITLAVQNSKDDTSFIGITLFGKIAETVNEYCRKGDLIGATGIIKKNNWEDKKGNKHYEYAFLANKITFLSKSSSGEKKVVETAKKEEKDPYEEFANENEISQTEFPW